jgi:hypothetical protein
MPTFGFSAYLKLISLNEKPRGTAIRGRIAGGSGGYDFHRSMKREAARLMSGDVPIEEVLLSLQAIKRMPERQSAIQALTRLAEWRKVNPGGLLSFKPATYAHPSGLFKVTFTPDFGALLGGKPTAVHIWNTARPILSARTVYSALSLFPGVYEDGLIPEDFALLSLREPPQIYRLNEAGRYASLGESAADKIAEGFRKAIRDLGPDDLSDPARTPPL